MRILLTNDDGINGEGLTVLAAALKKAGHDVTVVAPDCNNSAVGHKINLRSPLRLTDRTGELGYSAYTLSGTPADCVIFALHALGVKTDIILSGINDGNNLGSDCMYSGTVSAAQEGAQNGIPAIAFSTDYHCDREDFSRVADIVLANLEEWSCLAGHLQGALNVNIPAKTEYRGIRICGTAKVTYFPEYRVVDEGGVYEYRFGRRPVPEDGENDVSLYRSGYITVTPLQLDMTDRTLLSRWKK